MVRLSTFAFIRSADISAEVMLPFATKPCLRMLNRPMCYVVGAEAVDHSGCSFMPSVQTLALLPLSGGSRTFMISKV